MFRHSNSVSTIKLVLQLRIQIPMGKYQPFWSECGVAIVFALLWLTSAPIKGVYTEPEQSRKFSCCSSLQNTCEHRYISHGTLKHTWSSWYNVLDSCTLLRTRARRHTSEAVPTMGYVFVCSSVCIGTWIVAIVYASLWLTSAPIKGVYTERIEANCVLT